VGVPIQNKVHRRDFNTAMNFGDKQRRNGETFLNRVIFKRSSTLHLGDWVCVSEYTVSQELRSLIRDLIPELILSQKVIYTWVQLATVQEFLKSSK